MRKLLAVLLAFTLWFNFAPKASAITYGALKPCSETPAFQQKAKTFVNTTADPESGKKRAERYAQALCGPEGYPHLIADGNLAHAGDFVIPSLIFLYIAGWIGWVGRSYLISIRKESDAEIKEVIIDVPRAIKFMIGGFIWPLAAVGEYLSGQLTVKDSEISVSPR